MGAIIFVLSDKYLVVFRGGLDFCKGFDFFTRLVIVVWRFFVVKVQSSTHFYLGFVV